MSLSLLHQTGWCHQLAAVEQQLSHWKVLLKEEVHRSMMCERDKRIVDKQEEVNNHILQFKR